MGLTAAFVFIDTLPKMQSVLVPSQLRLIPLLSTTLVHVVFVAAFTAAGYMAVQSRHTAVTPLSMFLFVLTVHSANVNVAEGLLHQP